MSAIVLDHISKNWGPMRAVDSVSLTADEGSLLVLLGPSGCGKSTTLRLIAGLEQPDGGSITIGGADVTNLTPAERKISMVFQSYALWPHMSVARNVGYALEVRGDSMMEAGILDGDTVLIQRNETADTGDIVVALIDEEEATLKRFRRRGASIALEPANAAYEVRILPPNRVRIQGKLVALVRKYH